MFQKIEHISNHISNIEESIGDQRFIINELERELAIIADRLKKISSPKLSSVKTTVHKGTQTNDINLNHTSFPRIDPPSTSNPQSLPHSPLALHSTDLHSPAPKSAFSAVYTPHSRPATYWRSTPSSCPTPPRAEDPCSPTPNPRPHNRAPPTPTR